MKVVVLGAGIVGSSVAYFAARAGAAVTLIDKEYPGSGASSASFAWTNSNGKPPADYHALNVRGIKGYSLLAAELGVEPWMHRSGSIEWRKGTDADSLAQRIAELQDLAYPIREISVDEAVELEPGIDANELADALIALSPGEGWVDPVVYCGWLVDRAVRQHGLSLQTGTRVTGVTTRQGRVSGVTCADGRHVEADMVIGCLGTSVNDLLRDTDFTLPLVRNVGYLAFTRPAPVMVSRPLHGPDIDIRPDGAGRLLLRRDRLDEMPRDTLDPHPDGPTAQSVIARAREVLPQLRHVPVEAVRITERPIPGDGLSAVGPIDDLPGLYIAVTHSGVTLAPIIGDLVARETVLGETCPELASFRPGRFSSQAISLKRYKGGM
ncbi:FAD-binding oxidoreductase [Aureimonas altamirensis]|uniref:NAD(P)/FAD-dependent oxidoreductase n=1 Tax=Aureimonas altamirensis TaxID=370622 RepID=UPI00301AEEC2